MLNAIYRNIGNIFSPAGEDARLNILIYHRVLPETDPLFPWEVTADSFDKQISILNKVFNILPLNEAITKLKSGKLPSRPACITFDDGYADNVTYALPILKRHNVQATFFIATAFLNGGRMFNDTIIHSIRHSRFTEIDLSELGLGKYKLETLKEKTNAIDAILKQVKYLPIEEREFTAMKLAKQITDIELPTSLMMNTKQLLELRDSGMTIGGHTANHPILAKLDIISSSREILEGKEYLESVLGHRVNFFAYPNGKANKDYLSEHINIVRNMGFEAAFSTQAGASTRKSDYFQLPRYTPYSKQAYRFAPMLLQNMMHENVNSLEAL